MSQLFQHLNKHPTRFRFTYSTALCRDDGEAVRPFVIANRTLTVFTYVDDLKAAVLLSEAHHHYFPNERILEIHKVEQAPGVDHEGRSLVEPDAWGDPLEW